MLSRHPLAEKLFLILAVLTAGLCAANIATAQSVPLLVQAESMTLVAPMAPGYDIAAMGGRFVSIPSGSNATNPTPTATVQVTVPTGTYFLWARLAGPTTANDALYVGIGGSFARVFPQGQGAYEWVKVPTSDGGTTYGFPLGGTHTIQAGYGEVGAKLDALYLTNSATDVPSFSAPARLLIQGEEMTLAPNSQMTVVNDTIALDGKYLATSAPSTTTPPPRATVQVHLPAGTYYLWARVGGANVASDAMYVGIDSLARTFPDPTAPLAWARVRINQASSDVAFVFPQSGVRTIQVGEGETNARLDAMYLTTDATEVPSFAPLRRLIEAEALTPEAVEPPMTVGTDSAASGGQYRSATTGTSPATRVRAASATFDVPAAGTYYLWARVKGLTATSDAIYAGFDNAWDRVFPSVAGAYEWVRVENAEASGAYGTVLHPPQHVVQVGVGEIGARVDALYITDDANDTPISATASSGFPAACALPDGGYEGFGRNALRDPNLPARQVYRVTSLDDPGVAGTQGTLRDALSQPNRCVVFDKGGVIEMTNKPQLKVRSNVMIDGFTAPSEGITLHNEKPTPDDEGAEPPILNIDNVSNVVVRGLRIRKSPGDAIRVENGAFNVVVDHVSVTNFGDGALDVVRGSKDVTIQWSILGHGKDGHNFPTLIKYNTTRVSVHHNLYIQGENRNPHCGVSDENPPTPPAEIVCDVRNNLVWNFSQKGTAVRGMAKGNVINNYYRALGATTADLTIYVKEGGVAHVSGNHSQDGFNVDANSNRSTPFDVPEDAVPDTTDARTAAQAVKANAGAHGPNFVHDQVDRDFRDSITIP